MLQRTFTAERINEIVNHPSVFPHVKGLHVDGLDLKNITGNPKNICLLGEHGCVIFVKHQPGVYEFHTCVFPEGRGPWMIEGSREAFRYMFTRTDAFELMTKCPDGNVAAKAGARAVGCLFRFSTRPIWPVDDTIVAVDVHSIIIQEWVKTADVLESGQWFHEMLEAQYKQKGADIQIHENDPVHDRYVGATVEMMRYGQIMKAIYFYNRWAAMSDYRKISLVSTNPVIIDIFESKVLVEETTFKVV